MRQLIRNYSITGDHEITVLEDFTIEDIRLIVDETIPAVLASSMQKSNILNVIDGVITFIETTPRMLASDVLTIEIDLDNIVKKDDLNTATEEIKEAVSKDSLDASKEAFYSMKRTQEYLCDIEYNSIDYEDSRRYLLDKYSGACTCVWKDGVMGRNYDYNINHVMDYLVRIKAHNGKLASVGTASVNGLTKDNYTTYSEEYKYLPFRALDGVNESGLSVAILLLNNNYHNPEGTTPIEERETISTMMCGRYILDNFKTATEAVNYISDYVRVKPIIYTIGGITIQKDVHFMVADKTDCYALEFIGDEVIKIHLGGDGELPAIMTNFLISRLSYNEGVIDFSNLEDYAQGIERYQIAQNHSGDLQTLMMEDLRYTKLYTDNVNKWLTDCSGDGVTYKQTALLEEKWLRFHNYYISKTKEELREDGEAWLTVHSILYDLNNLTMKFVTLESDEIVEIDYFKTLPASKDDVNFDNIECSESDIYEMWGEIPPQPIADNQIIYTASLKLSEVTSESEIRPGLHIDAFDVLMVSHTFDNDIGIITFDGPVTVVGPFAFLGCPIKSITFSNSVVEFTGMTFYLCYLLKSVTLGNSVTYIGPGTFMGALYLQSINIPESVTEIAYEAFFACMRLKSITIPDSVLTIGDEAFANCIGPTSIKVPESVSSIGERAFYYVNNIEYYGSLTGAPWNAKCLNGYSDELFVYTDSTKTILVGCAYPKAMEELVIPNSVTTIKQLACSDQIDVLSINIPNSVTEIENNAFVGVNNITYHGIATYPEDNEYWGAKYLNGYISLNLVYTDDNKNVIVGGVLSNNDLIISESVTEILDNAFVALIISNVISYPSIPPILGYGALGADIIGKIYVPENSVEAYKNVPEWSDYSSIIYAI